MPWIISVPLYCLFALSLLQDMARKSPDKKSKATADIDLDNPEFQNALKLITYTNRSVFLTGKAGTGKSTFLRYITTVTQKKHVVLAPTGIAAVNAGGQTIHSFFKLPFKPLLPDDPDFAVRVLRQRMKYSSTFVKLLRNLELIIIDEISMVRADIIDFIDKILRVYSGNMRQPFGGKQMLFVGDIFQLEPVVTGDARDMLGRFYSAPYFFNAMVFREFSIIPIELRKVYRQNEEAFISLLDRVRTGSPLREDIELLNAKVCSERPVSADSPLVMTIATRRDMVDNINERRLDGLTTPVHEYEGKIEGDFPLASLPTDRVLRLKVGAQVVFIKNDMERRWVNGTLAIIDSLFNDKVCVRTEDGVLHTVVPEMWNNVKYVYNEKKKTVDEIVLGSYTQYPLKLAWAITIHKSQGLTFSNVVIDLGHGAFTGGQVYVALSRCRSLEGIEMRATVNERDVYVHPEIVRFSRNFNNSRLIDAAVAETRADDLYARAAKAADSGNITEATSILLEAKATRDNTGAPAVQRLIRIKAQRIQRLLDEAETLRKEKQDMQKKLDVLSADYVNMGLDCAEAGGVEIDAALANFDKAIDLSPSNGLAWLGKAQTLAEAGQTEAAYTAFQHAERLLPDNTAPLIGLGDLDLALGDSIRAMERYIAAHDRDPHSASALRRLIDLCTQLGDTEQADHYSALLRRLSRQKK